MPFPNFEGKHAHDAFFSPQDFLAHLRTSGRLPEQAVTTPAGVVVCYQPSLLRHVVETERTEPWTASACTVHLLERTGDRVGVAGGFGIGAPLAAIVVEELIAFGVREFVTVGTAGGLQPAHRVGDVVVCSRAVRDEGVSHHYLAPAPTVLPSPPLTTRLKDALERAAVPFHEGPTWTIDTPYRETVEEVRHYQREGVATVEMEAAAVFAVAEHRGVAAAAAFAISDSLADLVWDPQFETPAVRDALHRAYRAAVETLATG
ncbi:MAG: nucleoside phosphorylase [Chloroflexia bacterium]|nr:nucleoside phosphorylase [Chloroflexia bacterium]